MALRDQPYIPLYVQDFLTDEKLIECSAEATGVYIRLICILHKTEEYGKILLKQKDKQTSKHTKNFALKLHKQMPYTIEVIEKALDELVAEDVIQIEGDYLYQKRMVRDNEISIKRSISGKIGGEKTKFASRFAKAKSQANSENEYEYENEIVTEKKKPKKKRTQLEFTLPEDIKPDVWAGFEEMRRGIKAPLTHKARLLILSELEKIGGDKNAILEQSISRSWRGVFPLRTQPAMADHPADEIIARLEKKYGKS
jgi:hypothetical protein